VASLSKVAHSITLAARASNGGGLLRSIFLEGQVDLAFKISALPNGDPRHFVFS
jgi:hypothetical protein